MNQLVEKMFHTNPFVTELIVILLLAILSFIIYLISKKVILRIIFHVIKKTKNKWDDAFMERKVLDKVIWLLPLLFLYLTSNGVPSFQSFIQRVCISLMIWVSLGAISSLLTAVNDIYLSFPKSANRPIKGYLQIITIFFFILGIIAIIATLLGKSPLLLISGLGAMTAVILLIFKDTILSFLASIQITVYDLIKIGDWLEVPQFNADGDVIDVALHTIKIRNWDKTITTIPTHKLIEGSFKNWRGMTETGGRRIKRSINIDISTIKFCDSEMLEKFEKFTYLKKYLKLKKAEIKEYNEKNNVDESQLINGRRLTNIGTFRAYIGEYLKQNTRIDHNLTFLIRQLAPTPLGVPIQVYVFTNDTAWVNYEAIQSDIFDHLLAIVQQFDLKVFQNPSGNDLSRVLKD
ncbi:MAG: mechanosensitive ion channel family protein [Candidatus Cloacimonetes bacterium]|nr:mechanosensitive ion channel family protein [Candidatus Cloacimonadota bacterium]